MFAHHDVVANDKAQQEWSRLQLEMGRATGADGRPSYQSLRREFYGVPRHSGSLGLSSKGNGGSQVRPIHWSGLGRCGIAFQNYTASFAAFDVVHDSSLLFPSISPFI